MAVVAVVIFAVPLAGCGGDDGAGGGTQLDADPGPDPDSPTPTATQVAAKPAASGRALTIHMTEYAFDPNDAVAKAGKVTISAPNDGAIVHELVLLKTNADPAALPKKGDAVDESSSVGEIADVAPGSTKKATFKLAAGQVRDRLRAPGPLRGRHVRIADGRRAARPRPSRPAGRTRRRCRARG